MADRADGGSERKFGIHNGEAGESSASEFLRFAATQSVCSTGKNRSGSNPRQGIFPLGMHHEILTSKLVGSASELAFVSARNVDRREGDDDMSEFSTYRVDRRIAEQYEPLGSKPKFWFRDGDRRLMFKADDRGTGEDWAEVVACELCKLLGLPHVQYDLAMECDGESERLPGVICENMAPPPMSLVLGNQLLLAFDPSYPTEQRFKVHQHTIGAVASVLGRLAPVPDSWTADMPTGILTAFDAFVGYLMLDAWIANQDRHHENWGALVGPFAYLAPTFDHGAALARNVTDSERRERLSTKDANRTIAAFARRARSAFYASDADTKSLTTLDAFLAFGELAQSAKQVWLSRLLAVSRDQMWGILERIPDQRITEVGREFTLALLLENQRRLTETIEQ